MALSPSHAPADEAQVQQGRDEENDQLSGPEVTSIRGEHVGVDDKSKRQKNETQNGNQEIVVQHAEEASK